MTDYYGKSLLEEPIKWSRWARLKAWYRGYTLPKTVLECQRVHNRVVTQVLLYSDRRRGQIGE